MPRIYEVTGYDRKAERLVTSYEVPERRVPSVKRIAGVKTSDDGLGSYPLTPAQVAEIAIVMERPIEQDDNDFFLEPYEDSQHAASA
jgi:hypothetical protein